MKLPNPLQLPLLRSTPIVRRMGADTEALRARVSTSPNYRDGQFRSHEATHWVASAEAEGLGSPAAAAIRSRGRGRPAHAVAYVTPSWPEQTADLAVTWLGHASSLVEIDGRRFLLDPVFGHRASPSSIVGPSRLHPAPCVIADLPALDGVLISHDHYDHLDEPSIAELERHHSPHYVVPLGVDLHLRSWGVPENRITALDWREETELSGIRLIATEARHFSGRGFVRNQSLWAGWVLRGPNHSVWFAGDTGPTHRFEDIGRDLGPFDLTLVPIGAYSAHWPDIHLDPEQGIDAHRAVTPGAPSAVMLPIHWATFNLAMHWWSEPIRRARRAAAEHGVQLLCPVPGTRVDLSEDPATAVAGQQAPWWEQAAADEDHD